MSTSEDWGGAMPLDLEGIFHHSSKCSTYLNIQVQALLDLPSLVLAHQKMMGPGNTIIIDLKCSLTQHLFYWKHFRELPLTKEMKDVLEILDEARDSFQKREALQWKVDNCVLYWGHWWKNSSLRTIWMQCRFKNTGSGSRLGSNPDSPPTSGLVNLSKFLNCALVSPSIK